MTRRPERLSGLVSGRKVPQDQLTPRTPFSRSGQFTEIQLDDSPHETDDQRAPLLNDVPIRIERTYGKTSLVNWISSIPPILGGILALTLFVAVIISFQAPDRLLLLLGVTLESTSKPMQPLTYRHKCAKMSAKSMHHGGYWNSMSESDSGTINNMKSEPDECSSTITYMLDGYVGLFADIALMTQTAAFARERNRTFLIDDTYWNRGKWTNYFEDVRITQPGPEPGCKPPPSEAFVGCPRTARHWIINSRTAKYHFGHGFDMNYEDAYARDLGRSKPIFSAAYTSLSQTIRPNRKILSLIKMIRAELQVKGSGSYVGIHIRRGDRLAKSWEYHQGYVPIANFVKAANDAYVKSLFDMPLAYVASDSPDAIAEFKTQSPELFTSGLTVFSLIDSKHEELRELGSPKAYIQEEFNSTISSEERIKLTSGMVIDFALLTGSWLDPSSKILPGAIICTISSNVCKMSAVALGWEQAFGNVTEAGEMGSMHRWIEIDFHGSITPVWEPLETF